MAFEVVEQAKSDGWKVTPALQQIVKSKFEVIYGTKVVEDSFLIGRGLERKGGNGNAKVRIGRFWMRVLSKGLVEKIHRYRPLPWRRAVAQRGRVRKNLKQLHVPRLRQVPKDLRTIRSEKQSPPWYSPAPLFAVAQELDLELVKECVVRNTWLAAKHSWLCCLLQGQRLILRRRSSPDARFFFSLGEFAGVGGLAWPTHCFEVGGELYYSLDTKVTQVDILPVFLYRPEEWEARSVEPISALGMAALTGDVEMSPLVALKPLTKAQPLMEVCALNAFGNLSRAQLAAIAKHSGVELEPQSPLFVVLVKLIKHFAPSLTEAQVLNVIEKRLCIDDEIVDFMKGPEASHLVDEADLAEIQNFRKKSKAAEKESLSLTEALRERKAAINKGDKQTKSVQRKVVGKTKPSGRIAPPMIDDSIDEQTLATFMPNGYRVWRDTYNARWQLFNGTARIKAIAWNKHTFVGASKLAIVEAWKSHCAAGGEQPDWVVAMAADSTGAGTAASSGAAASSSS